MRATDNALFFIGKEKFMTETIKELFTVAEAAVYLGTTPKALSVMRCTGAIDIPTVQWGSRGIRFQKADLDKWIAEHKRKKDE